MLLFSITAWGTIRGAVALQRRSVIRGALAGTILGALIGVGALLVLGIPLYTELHLVLLRVAIDNGWEYPAEEPYWCTHLVQVFGIVAGLLTGLLAETAAIIAERLPLTSDLS